MADGKRAAFLGIVFAFTMTACICNAADIFSSIRSRNAANVESALAADQSLAAARDAGGSTPLHVAAALDDARIAGLLIDRKADLNAKTKDGSMPLHVAAFVDAGGVAALLIRAGADTAAKDADGSTALDIASKRKAKSVMKLLGAIPDGDADAAFAAQLQDGRNALDAGQTDKAYETLTALLRQKPDDETLNLLYGMACSRLGELSLAQLALENVVEQLNPMNERARLELAEVHRAADEPDEAGKMLRSVLSHDPPETVRDNVRLSLARLEKPKRYSSLSGRVDVGYMADDNANIGPNSSVIAIDSSYFANRQLNTLAVDEGALPVEADGPYASAALTYLHDIGEPRQWLSVLEGSCYRNWFDSDASSNESLYVRGVIDFRNNTASRACQLPLTASYLERGSEPLVSTFGTAPSYRSAVGKSGLVLATDAIAEYRDWDTLNDRDGAYVWIEESVLYRWQGLRAAFGLAGFHDHTDADFYRNTGFALTLSGDTALPANITAFGRLRYSRAEYDEKEQLAPADRKDDQFDATAGLSWKVMKRWGLDLSHALTENRSTFDFYQYDRNVTTISTFLTF